VLGNAWESGFRLFPSQALGLDAYRRCGGLVGAISVGAGKTLLSMLIAQEAFDRGHRRIVLLIPPDLVPQFKADVRQMRTKVRFVVPLHHLSGKSLAVRKQISVSRAPGLYVYTHSLMSAKDASDVLNNIDPSLVIVDEADGFARITSARTKRLMALYATEKGELTCDRQLVAVSGTLTRKKLPDFAHLMNAAAKDKSPLPLVGTMVVEWSAMIDSQAPSETGGGGPLIPLCRWAQMNFPSEKVEHSLPGLRKAFRLRMETSPAVVKCGDDLGTSLLLKNCPVPVDAADPNWQKLQEMISDVEERWVAPNGDELDYAMAKWKWLNELTAGFYNNLYWPASEVVAQRRGMSLSQAEDLLTRSVAHHTAGNEYARELRRYLGENPPAHRDTPMLVGSYMANHGGADMPEDLYGTWQKWRSLDFEGRLERDSAVVRVCDYKIRAAVAWMIEQQRRDHGGLVWYYHQGIGEWLVEQAKVAGVEVLHCAAGEAGGDTVRDPANVDRICIVSIPAHHRGKNLQHHQHQYIVEWPRPASMAEQMLGRVHRSGQQADHLTVVTTTTTMQDKMTFAACLLDALYAHQTSGLRQKLVYCDYDPLPTLYPPDWLRERGLTVQAKTMHEAGATEGRFEISKGKV